ncbi:Ribosome biogenesis protein NOC1 [Penicillium macrosclerotiorum]|uniref:Ribosome biogenesis protein NOC1 n=1 Tax=Penicillium macrosclerotiorum TaxID=303699 RepID=UPI002549666B|nr:Ribosome biogenesis protein NOC1 [Penicillium macrosclerotiorum]KAJ5689883.1 Ribosome biogenesis protein NOC1 [Penicillium macrosclerotiorum]
MEARNPEQCMQWSKFPMAGRPTGNSRIPSRSLWQCFLSRWPERLDNRPAAKDFSVQFSLHSKKHTPTLRHAKMVKGKGKRSSSANEGLADKEVPVSQPQAASVLPQLDESAFAGLRQKIEQRLKTDSSGKGKSKKNNKPNASIETTPAKKEKNAGSKFDKKQESGLGKKRDRNGDVIARDEKIGGKEKQNKFAGSKNSSNDDKLREEIMALGGTEEDLDLLAGVDSESEVEGTTSKGDDDLRKELSKMLEAAGHVVPEDLKEDEVEEEEEEEEDDQEQGSEGDSEDASEPEEDVSDVSDVEEAPPAPKKSDAKANEPKVTIPKEYAKLIVLPRSDWYAIPLPSVATAKQMNALPRHLIDRVHELAKSLLQEENDKYAEAQQASASSSHKFYTTIMSSGTLSDKISALTLAVQESPLHNTKSLETLINLGGKRSRAQAVEVLRSLKDMFAQGTLLPSDRRLKSFANQPGLVAAFQGAGGRWSDRDPLPGGLQKSHLIFWAFEDLVKDKFFEVLKILEVWCNDEIEFSRSRAVSYVYELLKEKPEQEANLLRLLVNKLGDPGKKIASRASYLLLQIQQTHPLMKPLIIKAVEELLFRPGQSQHAKYYAIITLNQTVLSTKEGKVAEQLLDIYFSLFVTLLKPTQPTKPGKGKFHGKHGKHGKGKGRDQPVKGQAQDDEMREKLTSGVLTGVNRAYPFTDSDSDKLSKHLDTLFRITHSSNFNTSIQALMLIQQLTGSHQVASDRFYRTLYESLLDPRVATSSKQSLYLNLLFKALKNDLNVRRVKAFVKRIVQVLGLHGPSFICGVFYLIRELEKTFTGLQSMFDQPEDNESDGEEVFRDVPDEDDEQPEPTPVVQPSKAANGYDPRKRDPEHSNADKTCLWELLPYTTHFHPSVSLNAARLLEHETMSGKPDLTLHTLTHFLDRFVYRAPKAAAAARGASIMQPLAGGDAQDRLVEAYKSTQHRQPLNSEAFWKKKADDVAAEDVFFHEYFTRVNKEKTRGKKGKGADADEEGAELSENEDEIWKALVDSRPELEADDDSDDDLDMDDMESAFDDDDEDEVEGEGEGSDDEVIFNDESDGPSDEEMAEEDDFGFDEEEEEVPAPQPATTSKKATKKAAKVDEEDEDAFDMDVSDDEAFVDSDEDLPSDMELGGVELAALAPTAEATPAERKKRRKLKHLPTFASADDYAALLADEDEGM